MNYLKSSLATRRGRTVIPVTLVDDPTTVVAVVVVAADVVVVVVVVVHGSCVCLADLKDCTSFSVGCKIPGLQRSIRKWHHSQLSLFIIPLSHHCFLDLSYLNKEDTNRQGGFFTQQEDVFFPIQQKSVAYLLFGILICTSQVPFQKH